jgi:tyrosinase
MAQTPRPSNDPTSLHKESIRMSITRRRFLSTAATAVGGTILATHTSGLFARDGGAASKAARWRRYDVASPEGRRMLASYARGVQAMLALPADDPRNWFRNAFTHFFDCPHGNWWFYAWHRGYVGYFERTIRQLSGDPGFAMPYWDWTQQPEIPASMFQGVLTPTDAAYAPYTRSLAVFTDLMKPALSKYWDSLSNAQRKQLDTRGYSTFELAWNDVTGYNPAQDVGVAGNMAYAITCGARYLSPDNPQLDAKTKVAVSRNTIRTGLLPRHYYDPTITASFTSSKTATHLMQPNGATQFSVLEGQPHNKVHNCIGGVGAIDYGPYGNMTNFLSPVDPVFFLHHANMDRLWHVWTLKQLALGLPLVPEGDDFKPFMEEAFLFYVNADGTPVGPTTASAVFSTADFEYDYAPGYGADFMPKPQPRRPLPSVTATIDEDSAMLTLPKSLMDRHLAETQASALIAEITIDRPDGLAASREFDVLVNAPDEVTRVTPDSPYYAGTISFFGPNMPGMAMSHTTTFALPLPHSLQAFAELQAGAATLDIRLVPTGGQTRTAPKVLGVTVVAAD